MPKGRLTEHEIELNNNIVQHLWLSYDHYGRLKEISFNDQDILPQTPAASYSYDAENRLIQIRLADGVQNIDYSYNIAGWLTQINDVESPEGDQFALRLKYWENLSAGTEGKYNGTITELETLIPGLSPQPSIDQFEYDHLNRLTSSHTIRNQSTLYNSSYNYDIMGNIEKLSRHSANEAMDVLDYSYEGNLLSTVTDSVSSSLFANDYDQHNSGIYEHDASGNLTRDQNRQITNLIYNYQNLPTEILKDDGTLLEYGYDANGRRIWKKRNGEYSSWYLRNEQGSLVAEIAPSSESNAIIFTFEAQSGDGVMISSSSREETLISEGFPLTSSFAYSAEELANGISIRPIGNAPVLLSEFSTGSDLEINYAVIPDFTGGPLGERRYYADGATEDYYYLKDHLNHIRVKIRNDGQVAAANDYFPFGEIREEVLSGIAEDENKFKFQSKERDALTGFDYVEARFFDASIGRFTGIDPQAEKFPALSPYNYALNTPLNLIDPAGEIPIAPVIIYMTYLLSSPDLQMDIEQLGLDLANGDHWGALISAVAILAPGMSAAVLKGLFKGGAKLIKRLVETGEEFRGIIFTRATNLITDTGKQFEDDIVDMFGEAVAERNINVVLKETGKTFTEIDVILEDGTLVQAFTGRNKLAQIVKTVQFAIETGAPRIVVVYSSAIRNSDQMIKDYIKELSALFPGTNIEEYIEWWKRAQREGSSQ